MSPATAFLINILLALVWAAATGIFSVANLAIGFALSFVILLFAQRVVGGSAYFLKFEEALKLGAFFAWELVMASVRVAIDVVTPAHRSRPGMIAIPLDVQSDAEITMLASLITLTPGTLSLEISPDRRLLYIHAMFIDDPDEMRRQIKDGLERPLMEVFR
jgi:multicomponent Na+:H+ antiporter subunit E